MNFPAHSARGTVLLVDDDAFNIELMEAYLRPTGYATVSAGGGEEAWALLTAGDAVRFDAILLDRMMPGLDGLALLERIKSTPALRDIPVIMQTAANDKLQVAEGVKKGAWYYLTKPYSREVLAAIVYAATNDYEQLRRLHASISQEATGRRFLTRADFACATLDEIQQLATYLATLFPRPENTVLGISEILVNAHEHGNLGITYAEKSALMREAAWVQEVTRREALPANAVKRVRARFERLEDRLILTVKDEGEGFDWAPFLSLDTERAFDTHGRGIAMARMMSFDDIEYRGCGNEVVLTVKL